MRFPPVSDAVKLRPDKKRLFLGAYGFEDRSLGWVNHQKDQGAILSAAVVFRYKHPKGRNRIRKLRKALVELGVPVPDDTSYDVWFPHDIEDSVDKKLEHLSRQIGEVVVDISAMTKLLILVCLCKLSNFPGTVRIIYSSAKDYAPTQEEYEESKAEMQMITRFPSRGFESIIRMKCLSSIRMQGQPVTMVAFTSFNEQLVRHMLGTISPHRLMLINGRPSLEEFAWRELAMQEIHKRLRDEYPAGNELNEHGLLTRVASTFNYAETITRLDEIYEQFGAHERIICAATGSKMQTVGLFFSKIAHPDIHIEYPTPDSYYVRGMTRRPHTVYEVVLPRFSELLQRIRSGGNSRTGYRFRNINEVP